ncbi:MAG: hypothetical protein AUJ60_08580 [Nitrospirae bacterium CG1_02_44_142]|nr:MAG: hypothetical protein AUJ60_08580 [Nitrospirae bacterium CG1_02_44_142]
MTIGDIIKDKGLEVIAVDGAVTVKTVIDKMIERNIGAVLVMEEGEPVGLFTERDALRCWGRKEDVACDKINIKEVMTMDILVATPDDDVNYAMTIMIEKNIRHLPVVEHGRVISVVSIRDIVKSKVSSLEAELHYLKDYITGG